MDEDRGTEGHIVQGLDPIEILKFMNKKKKRYIAIGLNELEGIFDAVEIPRDSKEFHLIRKLILDLVNEYNRSIIVLIFGDIEHERYTGDPDKK